MRGNVVDLAVAVIIGTAFGKIVTSLVENIVTPLIGILLGGVDLTSLSLIWGKVVIKYGVFLQSIFDFVVITLAIFLVIKILSKLKKKEEAAPETEKVVELTEEVKLLREIRDSLKK